MAVSRCIVSHKENEAHELRGSASYTCDTLRPYHHALYTTLPSPHQGKYVLMTSYQYYIINLNIYIYIYCGTRRVREQGHGREVQCQKNKPQKALTTNPRERYKQLITGIRRLRCPRTLRILTCPQKNREPIQKTIGYKPRKRIKICRQVRKGRI